MKNKTNNGFSCIGLDNPKNSINIGSALRAASCYDSKMVIISGSRYKRSATDTHSYHLNNPVLRVDNVIDNIPFDCVPVAIELIDSAISLPEYEHPERAFYIFGSEDATLGRRVLDKCRDVVYIPTNSCMNLAATVNVVLYDRLCKQLNKK